MKKSCPLRIAYDTAFKFCLNKQSPGRISARKHLTENWWGSYVLMSRAQKWFNPDLLQRPTALCVCFKCKADVSHTKKLPSLSSTRFCWRSYFEYYTYPLNRPCLNVGWREGGHTLTCCDPQPFHTYFHLLWAVSRFNMSSKQKTSNLQLSKFATTRNQNP